MPDLRAASRIESQYSEMILLTHGGLFMNVSVRDYKPRMISTYPHLFPAIRRLGHRAPEYHGLISYF